MKKYILPLASMLACNEIISTLSLLALVCMALADIARPADGRSAE